MKRSDFWQTLHLHDSSRLWIQVLDKQVLMIHGSCSVLSTCVCRSDIINKAMV